MSLRDDLARSLVSLVIKGMSEQPRPNPSDPTTNGVHIPFGSDPDHFPYMAYFDLAPIADECIRQMEWNARESFDSCCHRGPLPQTLTLAPEGWKP